jgi:hypothetical protein
MPKKRWTTAEQRSWLEERIPAFIEAQRQKTTSAFFDKTHQSWQKKWPVEAPTSRELQSAKGITERAIATKQKSVESVSPFYQILKNILLSPLLARQMLVPQSYAWLVVRHWDTRGLEFTHGFEARAALASISKQVLRRQVEGASRRSLGNVLEPVPRGSEAREEPFRVQKPTGAKAL